MGKISLAGLFGLLILASGCDGDGATDAAVDMDSGPSGPTYDAGMEVRIPESEAAAGRESCAFGRGAMPWETVGEEYPIGNAIPIRHFVVLMQENRSFDHYFGAMPGVDGIPAGASNPDTDGTPIEAFHTTDYCIRDVAHGWNASHRQYNGGLNDGFVVTNNPNGARAMGYLDGSDLPFYWDIAQTFAMSDHHFCSVLGPTWVNRYYFFSGTSFGHTSNQPIDTTRLPASGDHNIWQQLQAAGVSWGIYHDTIPWISGAYSHYIFRGSQSDNVQPLANFFTQLDDGTLPEVSWLDPAWADLLADELEGTDEHPPASPQRGQAWIAEIVNRVMMSPLWAETAIIFTYDEHGGFYDHVPPPEACHPNDHGSGQADDFDRLGFRVPLVVISPYSRPAYVSDRVTDLTSVLRLIQTRYLLPALTGRDANAWPMLDMFDFENPAFTTPPSLAPATLDPVREEECQRLFGG